MRRLITALFFGSLLLLLIPPAKAAPPTQVKDVLSSSQLSYFGVMDVGVTAGNTTLYIGLTGPSKTTNNLFVGDTLAIGDSNATTLTQYIVADIGTTADFSVTTGVGNSNTFVGAAVIATHSAIHYVYLTPQSDITAGAWEVLIKASSRTGEDENDGIPDQQGFDLGMDVGSTSTGPGTRLKTADVSCPWGATASVGTTTVYNSNSYHIIKCDLGVGETSAAGVGVTITIGRDLSSGSQLINPAPALSHTEGTADSTADTYNFWIRHLDAGDAVVTDDTKQGIIAVVESVRITATVDPTLTFIIDNTGVGSGSTVCGHAGFSSNADNTTAVSASFGSLSLGAMNDLAHHLSCVTNAFHGYVVTVYEVDQMKTISNGTTLVDTDCDSEDCDSSTATEWSQENDESGWGYSLQNVDVGESIFNYNNGVGSTFIAKAFGEGFANAEQIMKNTSTPTTTEDAYICYRIAISSLQPAGNYENQLVYTATATF